MTNHQINARTNLTIPIVQMDSIVMEQNTAMLSQAARLPRLLTVEIPTNAPMTSVTKAQIPARILLWLTTPPVQAECVALVIAR